MCGVIALMKQNSSVVHDILKSLSRLEYRGYDSCGIAVVQAGEINIAKEIGKVENLISTCDKIHITSNIGIGHTRWATHGAVSPDNAHPHKCEDVAVVHNGIIENYVALREELIKKGAKFYSQTDTEVIPVMINQFIKEGFDFKSSFSKTIAKLEGAYAIIAICAKEKDVIAVAKKHSPLVIGFGENNLYVVGSDAFSIISITNKMSYLLDGDYGFIDFKNGVELYNTNTGIVKRDIVLSDIANGIISKNGYPHYMLKEIYEQPEILNSILQNNFLDSGKIYTEIINKITLSKIKRIKIVACGTSYYSGVLCSKFFENYAKLACDCYFASEFRYKDAIIEDDALYIAISQSGETADVIGAMQYIKAHNGKILSFINSSETTMQFLSDFYIDCKAGPEISVASTKVFTAQILTLMAFIFAISVKKNLLESDILNNIKNDISQAVSQMLELLHDKEWLLNIEKISSELKDYPSILYLGRDISYSVAMEGALKMRELTYIHCEALAAGELKHGSIALIDKNIPVIVFIPSSCLFEKIASNVESIFARDGRVILISDKNGIKYFKKFAKQIMGTIELPETLMHTIPFLYSPTAQLLSYYTASRKGHDVDQPRNLAKSVTVE